MIPKNLLIAQQIYKLLDENAVEATEGKIFEGSFRAVANSVDPRYYQRVKVLLVNLECVRFLSKGHGIVPSVVQLIQPPTQELYNEYIATNRTRKSANLEQISTRISDLATRVSQLESDMKSLKGIIRGLASDGNKT